MIKNNLHKIISGVVQIGGWLILASAFLVTYDVITRKVFNISISGADEITGYAFAISTACAFSYALITRSNIRIDFIYNLFPAKLQRILDVLSMLAMAGFLAIVCYYVFLIVKDSFINQSVSVTPLQVRLAFPQSMWFAGLVFTLFIALYLFAISLVALLKGDDTTVQETVGIPDLKEEIQRETGEQKPE